jgi:DNA polymerase III subunit alpha
MQIARDLAGYSLGEADLLRRAMGKKIASEMDKHRAKFVEGAGGNGVAKDVAEQIFDQAAKFAGYGFNKGHAAAYAQVAFQTAYLKAHYPVEFLAASMTLDIERADRLSIFRQEAERLGVRVLPPDVNASEAVFTPAGSEGENPAIHFALAAIRNVGRSAMEHVASVRREGGRFKSLPDFAERVDPRQVSKRVFEGLAGAGAFDSLNPNRAQVMAAADLVLGMAARAAEDRDSAQTSLFGGAAPDVHAPRLPDVEPWDTLERLAREMEAVGFYLSGHPLDDVQTSLRRAGVTGFADLLSGGTRGASSAKLAGTLIRCQDKKSRNDSRFAIAELSDPTGSFEVWIFSELLSASREMLEAGEALVVHVTADWNGEDLRLVARKIERVADVANAASAGLLVYVDEGLHLPGLKSSLGGPGKGEVRLRLPVAGGMREVDYLLPGRYAVTPRIRSAVKAVPGVVHVEDL